MASPTQLDILIRTIADAHGIELTKDGLQEIKEKIAESSSATRESIAATVQSTTAARDSQQEQAKLALHYLTAAGGASTAAKAAGSLGRELGSLRTAAAGAGQIIGGVLSGNFLQMSQGFLAISKAAATADPAMKALFSTIASGASAAAIAAGPLVVAIAAMKMQASDNEKAMKSMWDQAAAAAAAYKVKNAEVTSAAAKDLEALIGEVKKVSAAYNELMSDMDKAQARAKEVAAAQKDLALAKAATPEEKAAIEAKFGVTATENDMLNAGVREKNARETQRALHQKVRDAEAAVRDAEQNFSTNKTRANQDAVRLAKENAAKVAAETEPAFKAAQAQIDAAAQTRTLGGIRKQTLTAKATTSAAEKLVDNDGKKATLSRTAQDAMERGDFATQDAAVAELRKMNAAAKQLTKAVVETAGGTAAGLSDAVKKLDLVKRQAANTRESGG